MKVIALYDFKPQLDTELEVKKNDILSIVEDDDDWPKVKNKNGKEGVVPMSFIAGPVDDQDKILCRGKLKQGHKGSSDGELTLEEGAQVAILAKNDEYWWYVGYFGRTGYIPKNIITVFQKSQKTHEPKHKVIAIAPEKAMCDENATVIFAFEKPLPSEGSFMTIFKGDSCEKAVETEKINDFSLRVVSPKYYPAENTCVSITHQKPGSAPKEITQKLAFEFESKKDIVHKVLKNESDPMRFLCSSFKVEHGDSQNVDHILAGMLEKRIPEGIEVFKNKNSNVQREAYTKEIPTLLHFAAFYNLTKLAKVILKCPGAVEALMERNCQGMTPREIANMKGHKDLELILENQVNDEDGEGVYEDMYGKMEEIYEEYIKMDDVKPRPGKKQSHKSKSDQDDQDDQELYEDMEGSAIGHEDDEERYVQPRTFEDNFDDIEEESEGESDTRFKKNQMSEKELQVALLVKRVKERYITHDQALEMARILRLEPEVTTATQPKPKTKPKLFKKSSGPVIDELHHKLNRSIRTLSTSSGSSMSSVSSTDSASSSSSRPERQSNKPLPPVPNFREPPSPVKKPGRGSPQKHPVPPPRRPQR